MKVNNHVNVSGENRLIVSVDKVDNAGRYALTLQTTTGESVAVVLTGEQLEDVAVYSAAALVQNGYYKRTPFDKASESASRGFTDALDAIRYAFTGQFFDKKV